MYLSDIIILNYRSCRNLHLRFQPDQPNVLIGINDSGKSTILRAVGLLLETKPKFNFLTEDKQKNDVSNTSPTPALWQTNSTGCSINWACPGWTARKASV